VQASAATTIRTRRPGRSAVTVATASLSAARQAGSSSSSSWAGTTTPTPSIIQARPSAAATDNVAGSVPTAARR
jgi:hypothetical protein